MFIKKIKIKNYRLFPANRSFVIDNINIPDNVNDGSGITVFVGENGCGKSSILEAFALPVLDYKKDTFSIDDLNNVETACEIEILSISPFEVKKTMPRASFNAKGFQFKANIRARGVSTYLSSTIVSDQRYLQADGENVPETSPDLRVSVNNPFSGSRFSENDFVFLDKNRTNQIKCGTYNKTRFDRLMEDFNYQYVKESPPTITNSPSKNVENISDHVENDFLARAIEKFRLICGKQVSLEVIDNFKPFNGAYIAEKLENQLQIKLNKIGSGYEMFFSLIYSFYMAEQGGKNLIILIDEPELHLHPALQEKLVELLFEISKTSQVIMSTHSPLLIKQLSSNEFVKIETLKLDNSICKISEIDERVLPSISSNEINYIAFGLVTNEYHNELYSQLHELFINDGTEEERAGRSSIAAFDLFLGDTQLDWKRLSKRGTQVVEKLTIHSCIRNKFHHPDNHLNDSNIDGVENLKTSIEFMREKIKVIR